MRPPTQQQRLGIRLLTEQLSSYGLANLATAEHDAVEYLRELVEDRAAPTMTPAELRGKLDNLVLMVAATTGVALSQSDALEYATGALKKLSDLRAAPNMTAQEYAAHYAMGRAPYVQGERGADY